MHDCLKTNIIIKHMLKVFKLVLPLLTNNFVQKRYTNVGKRFGDDVSYVPAMGECIGFESDLNRWADWEKEYSDRGFRTVSLDEFIKAGGYGKSIDNLLSVKRNEGEHPILHAEIYRNIFLGRINPALDLAKLMTDGQIQSGEYTLPSTDAENDKHEF